MELDLHVRNFFHHFGPLCFPVISSHLSVKSSGNAKRVCKSEYRWIMIKLIAKQDVKMPGAIKGGRMLYNLSYQALRMSCWLTSLDKERT